MKRAIKDILFNAIARLPEQQREVFILREINGCSTKEVAEILGCSTELVKWRLHKARSSLRKILQGNNQYKNTGTYTLSGFGIE
ncbi:MAG: RNA polymerase sigma factor [Thermoanaerobacteraceae bacterium]|nr:RNA polymerase sigma factor [Thermoanaerobacteraceae bacterium]